MGVIVFELTLAAIAFGLGLWWAHRNVEYLERLTIPQVNLLMWTIFLSCGVVSVVGLYLQFTEFKTLGRFIGTPPLLVMVFVFGVIKYYTDLPDPDPPKEEPKPEAPPPVPAKTSVEARLRELLDKNKR